MSDDPTATADDPGTATSASGLSDQMALRRDKVAAMRAEGIDPHPPVWPVTHSLAEVRAEWADLDDDPTRRDDLRYALDDP